MPGTRGSGRKPRPLLTFWVPRSRLRVTPPASTTGPDPETPAGDRVGEEGPELPSLLPGLRPVEFGEEPEGVGPRTRPFYPTT